MIVPLKQWFCDVCGQIIESPEKGYVIWRHDQDHCDFDFKIIHKSNCDLKDYPSSLSVESFLDHDGLTALLSFLSLGPVKSALGQSREFSKVKNLDEFIDFVRRMQIPYYEEARRYFTEAEVLDSLSDANEVYPYQSDVLRHLIEKMEKQILGDP